MPRQLLSWVAFEVLPSTIHQLNHFKGNIQNKHHAGTLTTNYLGMQLGVDLSTSHVENNFIGTGFIPVVTEEDVPEPPADEDETIIFGHLHTWSTAAIFVVFLLSALLLLAYLSFI